jgi:hypothetical protein
MDEAKEQRLVVRTPRGSTIELLETGYYRVCMASGECQTVTGLHRANDVMYWKESQRAVSPPPPQQHT